MCESKENPLFILWPLGYRKLIVTETLKLNCLRGNLVCPYHLHALKQLHFRLIADPLESSSADVEKPGKLYYCRFCPKFFMRPSFVVRHERIHTGEKPYGCDICGRFFNTAYMMKRHKSVHTDVKPYKCNKCDKSFKRKDMLKDHQITHVKWFW